ncbi:MAG: hypothetical protein AUH85_15075 [Chloroflexi bacterium 13_1_40CM_4_68_4]|nr:MAG: hypothetical protein AUH85_15075 [Chloroflexi bacterium 13_1_40CM_4_68_4]
MSYSPIVLDIAIVLAVLAGIVAGWRRGFLVPVVAQIGVLLGLTLVYAGPLSANVPSGPLGLGAGAIAATAGGYILGSLGAVGIGLMYRFAPLRRVDHVLGIPLGAVAAAVTVYLSLVATVTVDGWLKPIHDKGTLTQPDIAQLQAVVAANPVAGAFMDPYALAALAKAAATAPITIEQLAKVNAALSFYEMNLRPALVESHIGPVVLSLGADLPIVGRHVDYPAP